MQNPPTRILIVRLSAHGDVVHTLPLLSAIKKRNPRAHVGWLVERSAAPLLEGHPWIDRLHISDRKRWLNRLKNPWMWPRAAEEIQGLIREIQAEGYHAALDPQGLLKSALWPFWAGIPVRCGFRHTREFADCLYTHRLPPMRIRDPHTPAVERYLDLARVIGYEAGPPEAVIPPPSAESRQKVSQWLSALPPDRPLAVLAPFTRWPSKHWEYEHWLSLIRLLSQRSVNIAILGAPAERPQVETLLGALPTQNHILNLAGRTDWPDLYALFEKTRLLIGPDSAPLHIADAVGVPVVIGLYGSTAPGRTGPYGEKSTALSSDEPCQPCFERRCPLGTHDCMRRLTPEKVMIIVDRALNGAAAEIQAETP